MEGSRKLNFDQLTWWGIMAILLLTPLAVGTVHHVTRQVFFFLSGATALFMAGAFHKSGARVYVDGFVFWLLGVLALLLFQIVPLGAESLTQWSPHAMQLHKAAAALGDASARTWISLDRPETMMAVAHTCAYLLFYIVVFNFALRQSNARRITGLLAALGIIAGAVGLLHLFTRADKVFWIYEAESGTALEGFFTFLINSNNAAALFNLSAFTFLGLGRTAVSARGRLGYTFLFILCAAGTAATMSRGGILALLVTMVLYQIGGSMAPSVEGDNPQFTSSFFVFGMLVVLGMAALFVFGLDAITQTMEKNQFFNEWWRETKLLSWKESLFMGDDFCLAGTGHGAFPWAFSSYNTAEPRYLFHHVENGLLQVVLDFGVYIAVPMMLVLLLTVLRRIVWGLGQALGIGLSCGVCAVGIQNLSDFSLSIPGVAVPCLAAVATLSGMWRHKTRRKVLAYMRIGSLRWLVITVPLALLPLAINVWYKDHSAEAVEQHLEAYVAAAPFPDEMTDEIVTYSGKAVQEHPADFRIPLLVSGLLDRSKRFGDAKLWLRQAESRAPVSDRVILAKAMHLKAAGDQDGAMKQVSRFIRQYPDETERIFRLLRTWRIDEPTIAQHLGTKDTDLVIKYNTWLRTRELDSAAERLLVSSLKIFGNRPGVLSELGFLYLSQRRMDLAEKTATSLIALFPEVGEGFLLQARIYSRAGRLDYALAMYEEARMRLDEPANASLEMLSVLVRARQWDRFEALAADTIRNIQGNPVHIGRFHMIMADRELLRNKPYAALAQLEEAEMSMPMSGDIALQKAQVFMELGEPDRASAEFRKALKIDPENAAATKGLSNLELRGAQTN